MAQLKYLVLDEADRILQSEFAAAVEEIIKRLDEQRKKYEEETTAQAQAQEQEQTQTLTTKRQTLLFSATMTKKVERLEKACLHDPVKIEVNQKYQTVGSLTQEYLFVAAKHKLTYTVHLLTELSDRSVIVFANTKKSCHHLSLVLHNLGFFVIPLHGEMTQYERMGAVEKFKEGTKSILVATDVAARGLDIPLVSCVINYDLPIHSK
ncbi:ATP-dependent RNA helicase Rrp3 (predicted), partial [Reticulomyxa filosa]